MRRVLAFAPGDLRQDARLLMHPPSAGSKLREIVRTVRPDVTFVDDTARTVDAVVLPEPTWQAQLAAVKELGLADEAIIFPELATSYYDWWSFPLSLIKQVPLRGLSVSYRDLEVFIAGLGPFFGAYVKGRFVHASNRYQPFSLVTWRNKQDLRNQVLALVNDEESRDDLRAVLEDEPVRLWERWLSRLYDGLEYMDYVVLKPGDVVLNCGVHGGGEIPYFLASLAGDGRLINIDPLGHDYLSAYTQESLMTWTGLWTEQRVALHDADGVVTLPVDESGMAAGGLIGEQITGLKSVAFRAARIDTIVEELGLEAIDMIKMDIEGAEPRALAGAEVSIRRFRPQLAISIYHRPEQFLEIPLQIAAMVNEYDFFVKNCHFISNETILYGIPKERPRKTRRSRISLRLAH